MSALDDLYEKQYQVRLANLTKEKLRAQLAIRVALASYGWYEITEPNEGNEALSHTDDLETFILGFVTYEGIVFEPGEDNIYIKVADYPTFREFVEAVKTEHARLVKEWY